jgi:hypothetical protein
MRVMRPKFSIALILFLAMLGGCIYWSYKPFWQFDHLEQNARKVITGAELQAWATRLIDDYPASQTNYALVLQMRTNYPPQLRGLAPRVGPFISVLAEDTNEPPCVLLWWGSGLLGAKGFCVGDTNFVMNFSTRRNSMWQPGVYFYRQ